MIRSGAPPNVVSLLSKLVVVVGCHIVPVPLVPLQSTTRSGTDNSTRRSDACSFYLENILCLHHSFVCYWVGGDVPVTDIHSTVEIATLMLLGLNNRHMTMHWANIRVSSTTSPAPIKLEDMWCEEKKLWICRCHVPSSSSVIHQSLAITIIHRPSVTPDVSFWNWIDDTVCHSYCCWLAKKQTSTAACHFPQHPTSCMDRPTTCFGMDCLTDRWQEGDPIIMGQSDDNQWCCWGDDGIGMSGYEYVLSGPVKWSDCDYPRKILCCCCGCQVEDIFNKPRGSLTILWYCRRWCA